MNYLIQLAYDCDMSGTLYNGIGFLAVMVAMVFSLFHSEKYGLKRIKTLIALFIVYWSAVFIMRSLSWFETGLENFGGAYFPKSYIYIPLISLAVTKILKLPFGKFIDYLAPVLMILKTIGTVACCFTACCGGREAPFGLLNPYTDTIHFPVQIIEIVLVFGIFLFLLHYEKKRNYPGDGKAYALMLILFGTLWLFADILKLNSKVFWLISSLGIHSMVMILEGTIWFLVLEEINLQKERKKRKN